jgi:hypothetical protein
MLQTLPNAVLDAVVERAGFGHGWRLEIASPSLRAASGECAARRLGKCRWVGGDRGGTEFKLLAPRRGRDVGYALRRPWPEEGPVPRLTSQVLGW